jgi:hypothetical protein
MEVLLWFDPRTPLPWSTIVCVVAVRGEPDRSGRIILGCEDFVGSQRKIAYSLRCGLWRLIPDGSPSGVHRSTGPRAWARRLSQADGLRPTYPPIGRGK